MNASAKSESCECERERAWRTWSGARRKKLEAIHCFSVNVRRMEVRVSQLDGQIQRDMP
jgi:hypothetical protein